MSDTRSSSPDSLFSGYENEVKIAKRNPPDIPGLWVYPGLLPDELVRHALDDIASGDLFSGGERDQVMLFEAPKALSTESSLPTYIIDLVSSVKKLLETRVPSETVNLLFDQPLARQVILNLYPPGQGISPHIDLPNRYADGILGCSLTGGCVMTLSKEGEEHRIYMPPRTIYVLSGEARWEWYHGIQGRLEDVVENADEGGVETILRDLRVSVTFRWMKEGADVLS
ncbi:hypothetical protein I302_100479 [Kwoniella bestiolae CBS 10118]|uniref:Fe2OG dioxygenase domain-containing protein n=1 Tax=Kwoniella bestiolae CBS 10118 TaxID=1296100 RepID=A0A1B9G565_9TREE|nr:hypothetical protein I302_03852 [Kwoniella bestiolae CBS 10118]OCF26174.1 hypothetical protein I302_03852 [Kwoniella bestiolae CBS 10118]